MSTTTKPFLSGFKPKTSKVETAGGDRYVRKLNAQEMLRFSEYSQADSAKAIDVMRELVLLAASDETGARALEDSDGPSLMEIPFEDLKALFDEAAKLNNISKEAGESAEKD